MRSDYTGKAVLITGGTMGIGLATGLAFGRRGARTYLTYAFGSADEAGVQRQFREAGAPEPVLVQADASRDEDTAALIETIRKEHASIEAFFSNVSVAPTARGLDDLSKKALFRSLEYCTWPLIGYLQRIKQVFGRYPRYVVAMSTDGMDHFYEGYEYVAISKAVLETFVRYLSRWFAREQADVRVNAIRTRNVITPSALAIHGEEYPAFVKRYASERHFLRPEEVGDAIFALCSGMLDAFNGQVLAVDRGGPFSDTLMRVYRHRERYGL